MTSHKTRMTLSRLLALGWMALLGLITACRPANMTPAVLDLPTASGTNADASAPLPAIVIGYNAPGQDGAQIAIMDGLVRQAQAKGWQVLITNSNRDSARQNSQIAYLIEQGVRAVVVVPDDSHKICESVNLARQAGVLFYTIDRAPLDCEINMAILSDNRLAGRQAGEAMIALLTERYGRAQGTVLEIQGDLSQNVAILRGAGFHEVVDRYADVQVISRPTGWQADEFAQAVQEVLVTRPLLDGIYLHSDCVGVPAILPVLDQLGLQVPRGQSGHILITGIDGCPETLQAIRDGYVDQTASQPFPDMGLIVEWIEIELNGGAIQPGPVTHQSVNWPSCTIEPSEVGWQLLLPTIPVTPANAAAPNLWGNHQPLRP